MNIMGTFTDETLNNIYKINKENNALKKELEIERKELGILRKNWNNLKSVLKDQIEMHENSDNEEIRLLALEDKMILFIMEEYEESEYNGHIIK